MSAAGAPIELRAAGAGGPGPRPNLVEVAGRGRVRCPELAERPLLICFAHAGGAAQAYFRPWRRGLAPDVEVLPIELPGRGARLGEPPFTTMPSLVASVVEALRPELDRPYALFGHSFGALVAYETARTLGAEDRTRPAAHLFVSGRPAPGSRPPRASWRHLDDNQLAEAVAGLGGIPEEVLRHRGLRGAYLPGLRADIEVAATYGWRPTPELICPVTGLAGRADPMVTPEQMHAWGPLGTASFAVHAFDGAHFYLNDALPDVLAVIRSSLLDRAATTVAMRAGPAPTDCPDPKRPLRPRTTRGPTAVPNQRHQAPLASAAD